MADARWVLRIAVIALIAPWVIGADGSEVVDYESNTAADDATEVTSSPATAAAPGRAGDDGADVATAAVETTTQGITAVRGRAFVPQRSGCSPTPCPPGTRCVEQFGRAQCFSPSPCSPNPCLNGGSCTPVGSTYACACLVGFSGPRCGNHRKIAHDACSVNPCFHGGSCFLSSNGFQCNCPSPHYGTRCEYSGGIPDNCSPNPCLNGGVCVNRLSGFVCTCSAHFTGTRCERHVVVFDACFPNPCLNAGACRPSGSSYHCDCVGSFHGDHCEHGRKTLACSPNPCQNNGVCSEASGTFSCSCAYGFHGARCEVPDLECLPGTCMNGGTCYRIGSGHRCSCTDRHYGKHCELPRPNRRACDQNPCLNDGICVPVANSYRCRCVGAFRGAHCEIDDPMQRDPCSGPNPCNNRCECVRSCRHSSGYYCRSSNGYIGKNCTVPPPMIQCRPSEVVVTVDDAFVREYDLGIHNSRLHMAHTAQDLAAQDCFATTTNGITHTFTVPLPFTKCGTISEKREGKTVVTNNIWLNRATSGGYDMPVPVICFECIYEKQYVIVTSLQPAVDQPPILTDVGILRVQGVIELCKVSSSCPLPCPSLYGVSQGAVYTVGEMIHLNIKGDSPEHFSSQAVIALKTLYLSCDGSPGSAPVVQLVTNGCTRSSQNYMPTTVSHSGRSSSICVSFQVPRLQGCTAFYIHAEVEDCGLAGCAYNHLSCFGQPVQAFGGRKRRSLASAEGLKDGSRDREFVDIFGPIYFIKGADGIPRDILFPNASVVDTIAKIDDVANLGLVSTLRERADRPPVSSIVGLSLLSLLLVLAAVTIAGICFRRSSSRK